MTTLKTLNIETLSDLYPGQTVFAPRTTVKATKWVFDTPIAVDTVTGVTMSVMCDMPLICHKAVATPEALDFIRLSGLFPPSVLLTYCTVEEAIDHARQRIAKGERLATIYPPMHELDKTDNLLVPTMLYGRLNDKANIADFVNQAHFPRRYVIPANKLKQETSSELDYPVFLKASVDGASGAGIDVRYVNDSISWQSSISWFYSKKKELDGVIVEDAIDVIICWCTGVSILDSGCRYLGAAIQLFDKPAQQIGNRIDQNHPPPEQVIHISLQIAKQAYEEGYRGIAGFDIGMDTNGKLFVFDLNFRINASTTQLMIHEKGSERIGASMSQLWSAKCDCALPWALEQLSSFVEKGIFVPTRLFDRAVYFEAPPNVEVFSLVNGIIFADSIKELNNIDLLMKKSLGGSLK